MTQVEHTLSLTFSLAYLACEISSAVFSWLLTETKHP